MVGPESSPSPCPWGDAQILGDHLKHGGWFENPSHDSFLKGRTKTGLLDFVHFAKQQVQTFVPNPLKKRDPTPRIEDALQPLGLQPAPFLSSIRVEVDGTDNSVGRAKPVSSKEKECAFQLKQTVFGVEAGSRRISDLHTGIPQCGLHGLAENRRFRLKNGVCLTMGRPTSLEPCCFLLVLPLKRTQQRYAINKKRPAQFGMDCRGVKCGGNPLILLACGNEFLMDKLPSTKAGSEAQPK